MCQSYLNTQYMAQNGISFWVQKDFTFQLYHELWHAVKWMIYNEKIFTPIRILFKSLEHYLQFFSIF